jgi:hypothetical protein
VFSSTGTKSALQIKLESCNATGGSTYDPCNESLFNSFLKIKLDLLKQVNSSTTSSVGEMKTIVKIYAQFASYLFGKTALESSVINRFFDHSLS